MTYTFDDAIKHWNRESVRGPLVSGIVASPLRNVPQQEYDRVKFMNRLFYSIIEQLREEYAPTIEMTEAGKNALLSSLEDEEFETFFDFIEYGAYRYRGEVSIDDLMRAWLHPELIKVTDE